MLECINDIEHELYKLGKDSPNRDEAREAIKSILVAHELSCPFVAKTNNDELYAYCIGLVVALRAL